MLTIRSDMFMIIYFTGVTRPGVHGAYFMHFIIHSRDNVKSCNISNFDAVIAQHQVSHGFYLIKKRLMTLCKVLEKNLSSTSQCTVRQFLKLNCFTLKILFKKKIKHYQAISTSNLKLETLVHAATREWDGA